MYTHIVLWKLKENANGKQYECGGHNFKDYLDELEDMEIDDKKLGPVLSYLSFFFKAPITNHEEYVVNSFSRQRETLTAFLKVAAGILPDDNTLMSFKFWTILTLSHINVQIRQHIEI